MQTSTHLVASQDKPYVSIPSLVKLATCQPERPASLLRPSPPSAHTWEAPEALSDQQPGLGHVTRFSQQDTSRSDANRILKCFQASRSFSVTPQEGPGHVLEDQEGAEQTSPFPLSPTNMGGANQVTHGPTRNGNWLNSLLSS